jgi:hypothetical protein
VAIRNRDLQAIKESDGPFQYCYTSVTALPGLRLPADSSDPIKVMDIPELAAEVFIASDIEGFCYDYDRGAATGRLFLSVFGGSTKFKRFAGIWMQARVLILGKSLVWLRDLEKQQQRAAEERRKKIGSSSGSYLIYQARGGVLEKPDFGKGRRADNVGIGMEFIDTSKYTELHQSSVHSAATAISLVLSETNGTPDANFLFHSVHSEGRNGLKVYSRTLRMGAAGVVVTSRVSSEQFASATKLVPLLNTDKQLSAVASLFVQSQRQDFDNLRSFISAWSALELLITTLERELRGDWQAFLTSHISRLPEWHVELVGVEIGDYSLRDRFYVVTCMLDLRNAKEDSTKFRDFNNLRNDFYHKGEGDDSMLPTHDVRVLFRKYLRLGLSIVDTP